ncbi:MAG: amidohydrolase family protein [Alphaproteobacteria bacterium]|nr:amidohydrolase family protein [Alphaproteobacteria bacterium]
MSSADTAKIIMAAVVLPDAETPGGLTDHAVLVRGDRIERIAPRAAFLGHARGAEVVDLGDVVLMPGLVNAHQHGRAVSTLQLGQADDRLEPYLVTSRLRRLLDPRINVGLVCARFLAGGVTTTVQTNTPLGSGDYEGELRAMIEAYDQAGLRAGIAVGCMDRGHVLYDDGETPGFVASLPPSAARLTDGAAKQLYAGGATETVALADRLRRAFEGHDRLQIGYGPAGPQWASDEMLGAIAKHADRHGLFVHFHGMESLAQAAVTAKLYPEGFLAHLRTLGLANSRTSVGHAVWMTEADAVIAAQTGVTFVRNPSSNLRLYNGAAPFGEYFRLGVPLAIGTDNLCLGDSEDFLAEVRLAGALAASPLLDAPPGPASADLFAMATVGGARMLGLRDVGRITPGWRADMTAISAASLRGVWTSDRVSVLDLVIQRGQASDVRWTMVGGRVLYDRGEFTTLDLHALETQAREALHRSSVTADLGPVFELAGATAAHYRDHSPLALLQGHWRPLALDPTRRF